MTRKEQIKQMVKSAVFSCIGNQPAKIFIFGSQANLSKLKNADIDIGIDAGKPITNNVMNKIRFLLNENLSTLFTFDVVDFKSVHKSFRKIALQNIEPIS